MDAALFDNSTLPEDLDARVRSELRDGEKLLWVGQPLPGRFARQSLPIVLFAIPWTLFSFFWMAMASAPFFAGAARGPAPVQAISIVFPLFGLPFVLIGFGMLSSPYWMRRKAKRTCYALTDKRTILFIAGALGSVEVRSYEPEQLAQMRRVEARGGVGDLIFEDRVSLVSGQNGQRINTTRYGFLAIENVHKIEELVRTALPQGERRA